jgi:uncharacterized membrane protein
MRVFGHPLHAIVVSFPIGLLGTLPLWDVLSRFAVVRDLPVVGFYTELAGLLAGAVAAVTGFFDLVKLPEGPSLSLAIRHAAVVLLGTCAFGAAFALRSASLPPTLAVTALDTLGVCVLAVGGWLGGHLVFEHGVGVSPRAPE